MYVGYGNIVYMFLILFVFKKKIIFKMIFFKNVFLFIGMLDINIFFFLIGF